MTDRPHPLHDELYTPITPEIIDLLWRLHRRYGSWNHVAYHSQTKLRVLRRIYRKERICISQRVLDRILTATGEGSIEDFIWFTPEDLVALGIWKQPVSIEDQPRWTRELRHAARLRRARIRRAKARWQRAWEKANIGPGIRR